MIERRATPRPGPGRIRKAALWWADRWIDVMMCCYYGGIVAVGLIGFRDPSVSMARAIGAGYLVYAFGMLILGAGAIRSVLSGGRRSEAVCLVGISLLTVLHGAMLALAGANGIQSGVRLMIGLLGAIPFAYYRSETVYTRRDLRKYLRAAEDADAAERRWKAGRDA